MVKILSFLIEVAVTLAACLLITGYLRPFLKRILTDLCGTEERAQFWTAFSNILLIGLPLIIALKYKPEAAGVEPLTFEVIGRLSTNLGGYLFALVGIGLVVSFFALVAPKPSQAVAK